MDKSANYPLIISALCLGDLRDSLCVLLRFAGKCRRRLLGSQPRIHLVMGLSQSAVGSGDAPMAHGQLDGNSRSSDTLAFEQCECPTGSNGTLVPCASSQLAFVKYPGP